MAGDPTGGWLAWTSDPPPVAPSTTSRAPVFGSGPCGTASLAQMCGR